SPDGLWIATGSHDGIVSLWDPLSGKKVWDRGRHQYTVYTVGFGRDSATMISGADDGLSYLWDLRPSDGAGANDLPRLWESLAGDDAPNAYKAMWQLADRPEQSVAFFAEKLRPVKSLIDLDLVAEGASAEEALNQKRLKKLLIDKDEKVESTLAARRAIAV